MKIKLIAFLFTFIITTITFGQINGYNFWTSIDEKNISHVGTRQIYPNKYKTFSLTNTLLKEKLYSSFEGTEFAKEIEILPFGVQWNTNEHKKNNIAILNSINSKLIKQSKHKCQTQIKIPK